MPVGAEYRQASSDNLRFLQARHVVAFIFLRQSQLADCAVTSGLARRRPGPGFIVLRRLCHLSLLAARLAGLLCPAGRE